MNLGLLYEGHQKTVAFVQISNIYRSSALIASFLGIGLLYRFNARLRWCNEVV